MRKMSIIGASQIFQSSGLHSLLELYHQRPCKQYSKNNAWNLNTNSNLNNNNKYNSNRVVPCAELVETSEKRYAVPLGDIYDAYYECIVNKGRTANAMYFTLNLEKNIRDLWRSINDTFISAPKMPFSTFLPDSFSSAWQNLLYMGSA